MAINNKILLLVIILTSCFAIDANAQTRRRKTKLRPAKTVTLAAPQPTPLSPTLEPEVISRAEDDLNAENKLPSPNNGGAVNPDPLKTQSDRSVKTVAAPAAPVSNNTTQEKEDRSLLDLERLSLAEGRAENFRKQLSDVIERESALRSKIEQLDYQMRPDIIQTETSIVGSLRPEEIRDSRRKMLENEKTRTSDQLTKVLENRTRLETAIINADMLVEKLRVRVEADTDEEIRKPSDKISAKDSAVPNSPDN